MNRRTFLKSALTLPLARPALAGNTTRFAIIADLQLWRNEIEQVFSLLRQRPVEFAIVAGDVFDMWHPQRGDIDDAWGWTVEQLNGLGKPWYAVPGNHDLHAQTGDAWVLNDTTALDAWAQWVGPMQFVVDTANSRIVGVNCESWDAGWIAAQFAGWNGRRVVVSHYPLTGVIDWWLFPQAAEQLADLQSIGVDWFFSAHRHQFIASQAGLMQHIVAPAVSYVYGPNLPDVAAGGVLPTSLPMRGWLEVVDGDSLTVELYRQDGQRVWSYTPQTLWFPIVAR